MLLITRSLTEVTVTEFYPAAMDFFKSQNTLNANMILNSTGNGADRLFHFEHHDNKSPSW